MSWPREEIGKRARKLVTVGGPSGERQYRFVLVVLFRSKLVDAPVGYQDMLEEMNALARTMPGFVDVKSFKADDGERLTLVWWQDEETLKGWRENIRHRIAQRLGRDRWYEYYTMEVAEIVRVKRFDRPTISAATSS